MQVDQSPIVKAPSMGPNSLQLLEVSDEIPNPKAVQPQIDASTLKTTTQVMFVAIFFT